MSRAEKMYGNSRKIKAADGPSEEEAKAIAEVNKTAGDPHKEKPSPKETEHAPDASGMISVDDVHNRELKEMHSRHEKERRDMHTRHEGEHATMRKRHATSGGEGGGKKAEQNVGKSGTEPG